MLGRVQRKGNPLTLLVGMQISTAIIGDYWRRKRQSTPVFLPGKSHGWKSVVGYSPWGRKESDMTEWLHFLSLSLWRTVWRFFKRLEIELPYDPAIPLLGIHTEENRIERDTCTPVFTGALFTIAGTWKQPRCPSADERIRKLWYIYTMEYDLAIKKNAFESVLMRRMKLELIFQSELSQK